MSLHSTEKSNRPQKFWALCSMAFVLLAFYLFYSAPAPLAGEHVASYTLSTEDALSLLAYENDVTRTLYTKAIVGAGKPQGLAFSEDWADPDVVAGPLPALFLRGVAENLKASSVPLGLYLGSDYPIESSNRFQGRQAEAFEAMRTNPIPQHFKDEVTGETIGMYPDFASAPACVSCHNEHERTSKDDWELGDLMGATTWSYPGDSVTTDQFVQMLAAYREGVAQVWGRYLLEIRAMDEATRPQIGSTWPSKGSFVPDVQVFQDSVATLSAFHLMHEINEIGSLKSMK